MYVCVLATLAGEMRANNSTTMATAAERAQWAVPFTDEGRVAAAGAGDGTNPVSTTPAAPPLKIVFDARMLFHVSPNGHFETATRIRAAFARLHASGLLRELGSPRALLGVDGARPASDAELLEVHSRDHLARLDGLDTRSAGEEHGYLDPAVALRLFHDPRALPALARQVFPSPRTVSDMYSCRYTPAAARLAAGGVCHAVDCLCAPGSTTRAAFSIVRPPGHHCSSSQEAGFCYLNNVAVAARHAQRMYGLRRVAILDWDVHHGDGTQHVFEGDASVLFVSIHRHDGGNFYPLGSAGAAASVGTGDGMGFSVNIPWPCGGLGDAEYAAAMEQLVLPVLAEFEPELILVSCGFDAAAGDPLGGMLVSPGMFGYMTELVCALSPPRGVAVVLEGGYDPAAIAAGTEAVTSALVRHAAFSRECPTPLLGGRRPAFAAAILAPPTSELALESTALLHSGALLAFAEVVDAHAPHWQCIKGLADSGWPRPASSSSSSFSSVAAAARGIPSPLRRSPRRPASPSAGAISAPLLHRQRFASTCVEVAGLFLPTCCAPASSLLGSCMGSSHQLMKLIEEALPPQPVPNSPSKPAMTRRSRSSAAAASGGTVAPAIAAAQEPAGAGAERAGPPAAAPPDPSADRGGAERDACLAEVPKSGAVAPAAGSGVPSPVGRSHPPHTCICGDRFPLTHSRVAWKVMTRTTDRLGAGSDGLVVIEPEAGAGTQARKLLVADAHDRALLSCYVGSFPPDGEAAWGPLCIAAQFRGSRVPTWSARQGTPAADPGVEWSRALLLVRSLGDPKQKVCVLLLQHEAVTDAADPQRSCCCSQPSPPQPAPLPSSCCSAGARCAKERSRVLSPIREWSRAASLRAAVPGPPPSSTAASSERAEGAAGSGGCAGSDVATHSIDMATDSDQGEPTSCCSGVRVGDVTATVAAVGGSGGEYSTELTTATTPPSQEANVGCTSPDALDSLAHALDLLQLSAGTPLSPAVSRSPWRQEVTVPPTGTQTNADNADNGSLLRQPRALVPTAHAPGGITTSGPSGLDTVGMKTIQCQRLFTGESARLVALRLSFASPEELHRFAASLSAK